MTKVAKPLLIVAVVLVVLAGGFAAWSGITWATAGGSDVARAREEVSTVGAAAVATLTSLDHQHVDAVYQRFLDVTTGEVHDDYAKNQDSFKKRIADSKVTTTAAVRETAVTDLNLDQRTAKILVVVDTTVKEGEQAPATKRLRVEAALRLLDDQGWKVEALAQVPYTSTGQ